MGRVKRRCSEFDVRPIVVVGQAEHEYLDNGHSLRYWCRMDFSSFLQRMPISAALSKGKDAIIGLGAKEKFNQLFQPYGEILELNLNSAARALSATIRLKGEAELVKILVHEYAVSQDQEGQIFVAIDGRRIETSREWLTKLINDKLGEQKVRIPERLGWLVQRLL
jgi:hypothetical protein